MKNMGLWMRWSWRDLRARWLQVVAIALIIALGTGVFAGLGGQETWRTDSLDTSYAQLNFHDLQMKLADGSYADRDQLLAALDGVDEVVAVETRLIVPTLLGGAIVIVGYLFAGMILSGIGAALAELPLNALQVAGGALVGVPLFIAVRQAYPPILRLGR